MSHVCSHSHPVTNAVDRRDPTRTLHLRNVFARDMRRRFWELARVIRQGIVQRDAFGFQINQMTPPFPNQFAFPLSADKIAAFMRWLDEQVAAGIITVRELEQVGAVDAMWTNKYVFDSYKRGVIRARNEMRQSGMDVPTIDQTGGVMVSMGTPFHLDRVGLLFARMYTDLKGVTEQMGTIISRILAQGMADGDDPRFLARKLVAAIDGRGIGELGITDSIGRFIPSMRRAEMLARTEIIRAHHHAMIQEYKNWGVEGVLVQAEFTTAGDERVCAECGALEGTIFSLEEALGLIPVHPMCRCIVLPYQK